LKAWRSRYSQGCRARSNPGLKLANAFGVHNEPVLYLSFASHQRRDERSFETIFEFTGFGLLCGGPKCPQSLHAAQKLMDLGYTTNDSTTGLLPKYFPSVTVSQARANAKII
jgi:hypothetical protein